jgi:hypothetical protein
MAVTRVVRGCIRRHGKGMRPPFRACSGMSRPLHRGGACRPRCSPRHLHRVCLPCTRTRHRAAPCRLEPAWCSSACTTRRRQSRAEGRRDSSVQVGFPYASVVVHASANRCQSTPRRTRPPSPGPAVASGGTWRRHGQVAHLACVTLPGAQASHRQKQSREHCQVKSVHTRFIHSVSRKLRYCALTRATSVPMLYGLIELCRSVTPFGGNRRQSSPRQGRSASWWRFNGKILMNPPTQAQ